MKYDISKILIRIKLFIVIFLFVNIFSTYSMNFYQDINGVYCIKDDGFKATSEWITYDFESDGLLEYYYFDWDGYLLTDTYTPDGYYVNYMGQWTENGIIQHKINPVIQPEFNPPTYYNPEISNTNNNTDETTLINKEQHKQNYKTKNSIVGISAVIFVFILIFLFIIVILDAFNKSDFRGSYKHKKKQNSFWYTSSVNKSDVKKTEYESKTQTDLIGERGEINAGYYLSFLDNKIFKLLKNVKFLNKNYKPTEIDFICLTDKCAFVIEVKNWFGDIYGNIDDENWYSQVSYRIVNKQNNPIKQNDKHTLRFKRELKNININMPVYSIVAFDTRGNLKIERNFNNMTYVVYIPELVETIKNIYNKQTGRLINIYYAYAHFKQYGEIII